MNQPTVGGTATSQPINRFPQVDFFNCCPANSYQTNSCPEAMALVLLCLTLLGVLKIHAQTTSQNWILELDDVPLQPDFHDELVRF